MRPALVEGALGRVADVDRGVEVGLADLEVDDVPALRLERAGPGGGLEGRLGADADHALCKLHARHRTSVCTCRILHRGRWIIATRPLFSTFFPLRLSLETTGEVKPGKNLQAPEIYTEEVWSERGPCSRSEN